MLVTKNGSSLYMEDIIKVLKRLPDKSLDMVYGDPDYNVGINYAGTKFTKKWNEYIEWYIELSKECLRVLKDDGNLLMMNYPKQNSHLRAKYLDDACYQVNDYVWVYNTNVGHSNRKFTTAHRSILHATKQKDNKFFKRQVAEPYKNPNDKRIMQKIAEGSVGRMPYSWFYFDLVKNVSKDKTSHACQIPLRLVEMLINATTLTGETVGILFGGSGMELKLCEKMGRKFVSAEVNKKYFDAIVEVFSDKKQSQAIS